MQYLLTILFKSNMVIVEIKNESNLFDKGRISSKANINILMVQLMPKLAPFIGNLKESINYSEMFKV